MRTGPRQRATSASQLVRRGDAVRGEQIAEIVDGKAEEAGDFADRNAALVHRAGEDFNEAFREQWRPLSSTVLSEKARGMAIIANRIRPHRAGFGPFEQIERNRNVNVASLEIAPDMEAQMRRSIAAEEGIRKFLVQQKILTVPDGIAHYTIAPIPEYLKALDGFGEMIDFTSSSRLNENARRYLDPPSERLGYFWLATAKDPRPDMVHEGVPGHYFQFALSWRHPNAIRRHFYDSGANEGIAFYAEEMMLQAGLFDDSPRSREIIYNFARLRALRVEVDIKLAIGAFDIEQAADYLERVVPMDGETARHEAAFFATGPGQAITYQIGKLQVLKFLADARLKFGNDFNLREFHDSLWLNGNVPIALQRWELLGLRDEIERLDQIAAGR